MNRLKQAALLATLATTIGVTASGCSAFVTAKPDSAVKFPTLQGSGSIRLANPDDSTPDSTTTPDSDTDADFPDVGGGPGPVLRVHNRGVVPLQPGAIDTSVTGYLDSYSLDRYRVSLPAGQRATFTLDPQHRESELTIVDPNGDTLTPQGAVIWSVVPPVSGSYLVDVSDRGSPFAYRLSVKIPQSDPNPQVRYRGEIQFAPDATTTTVSDFLPFQDSDRYTFLASAGQAASINIRSPGQGVFLTLIDPSGNPIIRHQAESPNWSGTLPITGRYTLEAFADGGAANYDLTLQIQPAR